jgi:protein SCO1/2
MRNPAGSYRRVQKRIVSLITLCALVTLTACAPLQNMFAPTPTDAPHGVAIDPPRAMPDFTLTNTEGKQMRLSDLRGKAVILFFGYTHCPDICPFSLSQFIMIKKGLGEDAQKVNFVMVSVDGTRDTPEVLRNYMRAFDATFIGLTGNENDVRQIGLNYGVHFEKQKPAGANEAYAVAHTTYTYLLDSKGTWQMVFPFKTPIDSEVLDIQKILAQTQ